MRNNRHRKIIALLLVLCMCVATAVTVSAAGLYSYGTSGSLAKSITSSWTDFWNRLFGGNSNSDNSNGGDGG